MHWTPYRRAPTGSVDERRIVGVVEENKEETRSSLYILGTRRDRTSTSINGTNVHSVNLAPLEMVLSSYNACIYVEPEA